MTDGSSHHSWKIGKVERCPPKRFSKRRVFSQGNSSQKDWVNFFRKFLLNNLITQKYLNQKLIKSLIS